MMTRSYPSKGLLVLGALLAVAMFFGACKQEASTPPISATASAPVPVAKTPAREAATKTAQDLAAPGKVARIVFIGKAKACDCTRKRVDDSFAALQGALADHKDIPVERLTVDIDEAKVAVYKKMRAIMALPAIYLLDGAGGLVEMLQGELSTKQLQAAIR
jgi:hypothetical protein